MSEMALKMLLNVLGLSLPLGSEKYTYVKVHNLQLHTYISKGFIINNLYLEILKRFIGIHDKGGSNYICQMRKKCPIIFVKPGHIDCF